MSNEVVAPNEGNIVLKTTEVLQKIHSVHPEMLAFKFVVTINYGKDLVRSVNIGATQVFSQKEFIKVLNEHLWNSELSYSEANCVSDEVWLKHIANLLLAAEISHEFVL